ncbi:YbaK/EbsC family protein [Phycisphaeraceae bacterium D3-23]
MTASDTRLTRFLDRQGVSYYRRPHQRDYRAKQTARHCETPPQQFAKTVVLNADGSQLIAVLPANEYLDLDLMRQQLGVRSLELLPEHSIMSLFPDCEIGAEPPFGNLYGIPVYVSPHLAETSSIVFNAGTHDEAVEIAFTAFHRLVHPIVIPMTTDDAERGESSQIPSG